MTHNPSTNGCNLQYVDGYLTCTRNHHVGSPCAMDYQKSTNGDEEEAAREMNIALRLNRSKSERFPSTNGDCVPCFCDMDNTCPICLKKRIAELESGLRCADEHLEVARLFFANEAITCNEEDKEHRSYMRDLFVDARKEISHLLPTES